MYFLAELNELKKVFLPWICIWIGLSFFFFGFGLQQTEIFGKTIYYPHPSLHSISTYFLETAKQNLLTEEIKIVTLNPLNAFLSLVLFPYFQPLLSVPHFFFIN